MSRYTYEATRSDGGDKPISGEIEAESVAEAIALLQAEGLEVLMIRATGQNVAVHTPYDSVSFQRNVQDALDKRELIIAPLDAMVQEFPKHYGTRDLRELVKMLREQPEADSWLNHPRAAAWLPLVIRGTSSDPGCLSSFVKRIAGTRRTRWFQNPVLIYSLTVFILAMSVLVGLSWLLIPSFGQMFREFELQLPLPTLLAVWISDQIVNHALRTGLIIASVILLMFLLVHWSSKRAIATRMFGRLVAGNTLSVEAISRLCDSVAEMSRLGASLPTALRIAGRGCSSYHYLWLTEEMALAAESGMPLVKLRAATWLPMNVIDALQPPEGGKPNTALLRELSSLYEERLTQRVDWLSWFIGPLAIMAVGGIVAFVVVALFMPLVSLVSGLM